MKKQLIAAAVAATMTSVAMADISITGSTKANVTNGNAAIEADLKVVGKSGDTSVVTNFSLDQNTVEDLYLTTSIEGVKIKAGSYRSGKSELDKTTDASARYNLSTTMGGITATYEATSSSHDLTLGGTVAGVSIKHKMNQDDSTETWVSGSAAGVDLSWNQEEAANGNQDTAIVASASMNGIGVKYVKIDSDTGTPTDGYVTKSNSVKDATAVGISTSMAGNTVTFKAIDVDSKDSNKVIITRPLASGATFEATYTDADAGDSLDLELAVKF